MYPPDALDRVLLARRAMRLGFTLPELAELLSVRDQGGIPCHRVLKMAEEKLRSLGQHIRELRRAESHVRGIVRQWRRQLERTPPGRKATLLHSLSGKEQGTDRLQSNLKRKKKP